MDIHPQQITPTHPHPRHTHAPTQTPACTTTHWSKPTQDKTQLHFCAWHIGCHHPAVCINTVCINKLAQAEPAGTPLQALLRCSSGARGTRRQIKGNTTNKQPHSSSSYACLPGDYCTCDMLADTGSSSGRASAASSDTVASTT